jgi:hypothetical protein
MAWSDVMFGLLLLALLCTVFVVLPILAQTLHGSEDQDPSLDAGDRPERPRRTCSRRWC